MNRHLLIFLVLAASAFGVRAASAAAADSFTVTGVQVDMTAESATAAREKALAQGRPLAWTKLYQRLTPPEQWPNQPQLDDNALQHLIRSFEISNERRSTTRYLADVTYHFNGDAVRQALLQSRIPFADAQTRPVLVVPVLIDGEFDPASEWAQAWTAPAVAQGVLPVVIPRGEPADMAVLSRPDVAQLTWADLAPLAQRYDASDVVLAFATPDGASVQLVQVSPAGRQTASFAFAQSTFAATAEAAAGKVAENWKSRSAVDYSRRGQVVADVSFSSQSEWARIRSQLASLRTIATIDVMGLSTREARLTLHYFGRPEQLAEALAQRDIAFEGSGERYRLQLTPESVRTIP